MSKITTGSRGNYDEKVGDKIKNYILEERRSVESVKTSVKTIEGEGIRISISFPTPTLTYIDPFLLLDEFGP
jgi:hypothetical protein